MIVLFMTLLVQAAPTPEQKALLSTFRREFIAITPGKPPFPKSFLMGAVEGKESTHPVHKVTFAYSFQVAKYEVPQNLWTAVMGRNPSRWKGDRNAVELLNFREATEFCKRTTTLMRRLKLIATDEEIRLPSESEWEYVARAGTKSLYSFGDRVEDLDAYAWSTRNAAGNDPPVGKKRPNPWGLHDIHGYLWEWCLDDGAKDYSSTPSDGRPHQSAQDAKMGVLRGGSWKDGAEQLTSAFRRLAPKDLRDDAVGLRCVLAKVAPKPSKSAPTRSE